MDSQKLPTDFAYLPEMYAADYFPNPQVDQIKQAIKRVAALLETGERDLEKIQEELDEMTLDINGLQDDFYDHGSEIETGARESIADTVERLLTHFDIDIDIEEALREREW